MARRKSRELAFILLFEQSFGSESMEEIIDRAMEARDIEPDEFALTLAKGTADYCLELDQLISQNTIKWSKERLSRVALSILRLSLYEMLHVEETPVRVAINEAVELAKKYGDSEEASFVNGVLGAVAREAEASEETQP